MRDESQRPVRLSFKAFGNSGFCSFPVESLGRLASSVVACPAVMVDADCMDPAMRTCRFLSCRDGSLRRFREGGLAGPLGRGRARRLRGVLEPVCPCSSCVPVASQAVASPSLSRVSGESRLRVSGSDSGCGQRRSCSVPSALRVLLPPWAPMSGPLSEGLRPWWTLWRVWPGRVWTWGLPVLGAPALLGLLLATHEATTGDACCSAQFLLEARFGEAVSPR